MLCYVSSVDGLRPLINAKFGHIEKKVAYACPKQCLNMRSGLEQRYEELNYTENVKNEDFLACLLVYLG